VFSLQTGLSVFALLVAVGGAVAACRMPLAACCCCCGATNVVNKHILTAQQDVADARTATIQMQQQQLLQQRGHLHMMPAF